jgi:hypothetical protein
MQQEQNKYIQKSLDRNNTILSSYAPAQYGLHLFSLLLELPTESLINVTSFLDPVSILFLGQVNKRLSEHVRDDATWRRAFLYQFCGIRPEDDLEGKKSLLIRRSEFTWRKELIMKWKMRRSVRLK